jgi:hypothetical protein
MDVFESWNEEGGREEKDIVVAIEVFGREAERRTTWDAARHVLKSREETHG